jgi:CHAT domain-containing protein
MKLLFKWLTLFALGTLSLRAETIDRAGRAESYMREGNYEAALPLLLEMAPKDKLGANKVENLHRASHALALGQVYRQLKSTDEAQLWLTKAESILRKETAPELLGSVLVELAELSPDKFRSLMEEAWQIWKGCAAQPELAANARLRLAEMELTRAAYAESKSLLFEADAWLEQPAAKLREQCNSARARLAQDLGKWHLAMGDFATALEHFDVALSIQPSNSSVLSDQALAYWRSGQSEEAKQSFQAACVGASPRVRQAIEANYAAAILSWLPADASPETILREASSAAHILEKTTESLSSRVTQAEALRQIALAQAQLGRSPAESQESCSRVLHELTELPDFKKLTVSHPLRRHAAVTRWMLEMMRQPADALPPTRSVIESSMAQLSAMEVASTEQARLAFLDPIDLASPVMALPEEERKLHASSLLSTFGLATRHQVSLRSLEEWKSQLSGDSALVAYFIYRRAVGSAWMGTVGALILSPKAEPVILDLGVSADNLIRSATQLRDDTQAPASKVEQALNKLGRQLWQPVVSVLGNAPSQVFVFLEGGLASVPLACLNVDDASVLDGPRMCRFISNPEVLFHGASRSLPIRPGVWLAVDASDVSLQFSEPADGWEYPYAILAKRTFPKLTNVEVELETIRQFNGSAWKRISPTEAALTAALKQPDVRVWHFAGHGLTESTPVVGSVTAFGNCLLCNGVNLKNAPSNDGLLFAAELAEMKLESLDLAVLSACDTGRGGARHGEAVFDLARACHAAGVRDVFVSAAPVQDAVAPALMKEFYRLLTTGVDAPQAAWEAQRKLYREHPSLHSAGYFRLVRGPTSRL